MKPLYRKEEFDKAIYKTMLPLKCYVCNKIFHKTKKEILTCIRYESRKGKNRFCSYKCFFSYYDLHHDVKCKQCFKSFRKKNAEVKKSPNHFCSKSCAALYNNAHKTHGTRKSKLEKWLEEQLSMLYPNLEIYFNRKDAIGSELDIYIPSLKLAFEINGIFHYKPIYGEEKLKRIQENDKRKALICEQKGIELHFINASKQKTVTAKTSQVYLKYIFDVIEQFSQ